MNDAGTSALFTADPAQVRWLGARILELAGPPPRRMLDVGCGDGSLLAYLARAWPATSCVGVDRSTTNVAAAIAATGSESPRVTVIHGDYLTWRDGRFDLVVASSTLQGIDAPLASLADKIAEDMAAGGLLIHATPYRCGYNTALNAVRAPLRTLRGPVTDRLILAVARTLHRHEPMPKLRERLAYMYLRLQHYEDDLRAALEPRGFRLLRIEPAPHTSLGQPKHRLAVMQAPRA